MIDAAQGAVFRTRENERRSAVRAQLIKHRDITVIAAEGDKRFTEQTDALRRAGNLDSAGFTSDVGSARSVSRMKYFTALPRTT